MAPQLAALCLLAAAAPAPAPLVAWPPGWTVADNRAQPGNGDRALIELVQEPGTPAAALAAAAARFTRENETAGFDAGCGAPAPVRLGSGAGTGLGCTASRNLPLVKVSLVAWPVPGGAAVLTYTAPPGAFETYLGAFRTVVASAHAGG